MKNYETYGDNLVQNNADPINSTAIYIKNSQGLKELKEKYDDDDEDFSNWEVVCEIEEKYEEAVEWMDSEAILFIYDIWNGTWTPANDFVTNLYLLQMK